MKNRSKYKRNPNKNYGYFILFPLLLLLLIYMIGVIYYSFHFYKGSFINGTDYSGRTVKQVEDKLSSDIHSYKLEIKERREETEYITADEIGLTYVSDGKVQELKKQQNPFSWPASFFRKSDYEMSATTSYQEDKLSERILALNAYQEENVTKPQNAGYQYQDGVYTIVEEVAGNQLKDNVVFELAKQAVENGDTEISLEKENCYLEPDITKEDKKLGELVQTLNTYVSSNITYEFGDVKEVVDGDKIKDWLVVDKEYNVSIDKAGVREFIDQIARTHNTFGKTRKFKSFDGSYITVKGGTYGWWMNRGQETEELMEVIKAGKKITKEPAYYQTAASHDENDIGNTYIEINLTAQHLWFFKDGKLMTHTDIVTGNLSRGHGTPAGTYGITYKERNATLKGEDYRTPVDYWMPFNGNIGLHDADWRNKFGGDIYKSQGSHGCVNAPPKKAELIYQNIEKGTPVILYYKTLDEEVLNKLRGITTKEDEKDAKDKTNQNVQGTEAAEE